MRSIILLLAIALLVPMLFANIPEKRVAAVIASSLFIASALLVAKWMSLKSLSGKAAVIFLFLWALPIFFLRVLNWDVEFSTLPRAAFLHRTANFAYLLWLGVVAYETWKKRKT